jgi:hypothetical protein
VIPRVLGSLLLTAAVARSATAQRDTFALADRAATAELSTIVSNARDAGLPVDPIFGKVRYGVVVAHAPADRIVAKVRALVERLTVARDALAPHPSASEITYGADALEYGATRNDLLAVRSASGDQPASTSLSVLAQLVASGVPRKRAAAIVTDLIKKRVSAEQLVALGRDVNADVASGAQANAALDIRLRGLSAVLAPPPTAAAEPGITLTAPVKKQP